MSKPWFIYIVRCRDNSLYTGITIDIDKRIKDHNQGLGAHYTKTRGPVKLVYNEKHPNRSSALKKEILIKSWRRKRKEAFIAS
ncbi:MAG: GIY-YIG nuclease family protein [Patescibacteria group bacterium]|nr:GIY-YIG nuclease family protein [Patescibacteria group bacterium]MDD5121702.1 GIY-YIG nuclease family protein [Patescibacteria group bacterium]MDD5221697.1 GIY-YIG nuclease family protein [Patescibacteria group bacterium]MDD5396134.1 GIY-YIG nuclease family protein [Patescibacteria group bacterium]